MTNLCGYRFRLLNPRQTGQLGAAPSKISDAYPEEAVTVKSSARD